MMLDFLSSISLVDIWLDLKSKFIFIFNHLLLLDLSDPYVQFNQ